MMSLSFLRISSLLIASLLSYHINTVSTVNVFIPGATIPIGNDSFYHLKRIADIVNEYPHVSDFDPDIYAPEGTWLTWPKGFDFLMASISRFFLDNYSREEVTRIVVSIPPYIGLLNIFLLYIILRLITDSLWVHILTLITYALSPLTLILHSLGIVDHHSFEHMFVLLSFIGVLLWYKKPDSKIGPLLTGIVMGGSQIFHAGLFILQVPLLLTITISYLKNELEILKGATAYTISLLVSTFIVSSNSSYFYNGMVGYYYLGWFHIYIAGLTSTYLLLLTRYNGMKRALFIIAIIMCILTLPLLNTFIEGFIYMRLGFPEFHHAEENKNIFGFTHAGRFPFGKSMFLYSGFPFLIPIAVIFNIYQCIKGKGQTIAFGSFASIFMILFIAQFRFHQYGSVFLFISIFTLFREIHERFGKIVLKIGYYTTITFLIFFLQYTAGVMGFNRPHDFDFADDPNFLYIFEGLVKFRNICEKESGIVLSDMDIGHYISYYTNCRVFSNNFNQTPFQWEKTRETNRLLRMSLNRFKKENKYIKYIFTTRSLEEPLIKKGRRDGTIKKEDVLGAWWRQMQNRLLYTPPDDEYFTLLVSGEPIGGSVFKGEHPFYRIYKVNPLQMAK